MLYTVTLNPSLDYYLKVNNLKSGAVNHAASERLTVGGKGINVSIELKELGNESVALGFIAGFTGRAIIEELNFKGLKHDFIETDGRSRINVKLKAVSETDVNGIGPTVSENDIIKLTEKLKSFLKSGDWLILSGSAQTELGDSTYSYILEELKAIDDIKTVVDARGKLLSETLRYKPFLIKPNLAELCEFFGITTPTDNKTIESYAFKLRKLGAKNVIVSLGGSGAIMCTETDQTLYVRAARGQLVNSVGAGDCMVAGFIHEFIKTGNYFKSLNFATAAGSACAFTEGFATKEQIDYVEDMMI